jgi:hypothetical protein
VVEIQGNQEVADMIRHLRGPVVVMVWVAWVGAVACGGSNGGDVENTLELCQDGKDNDGDELADCDDPDCQVFLVCASAMIGDAVAGTDSGEGGGKDDMIPGGDALGDGRSDGSTSPGDAVPELPKVDTGKPGFCEECGYGSLKGRVCAPNEQIFVSGALITIETTDCSGNEVTLTAISQVDGTYYFESVPCGYQTVNVSKGNYVHEYKVPIRTGELMDVSGADIKMCFGAKVVSIAAVWGQWDEMHHIVERLGFTYDWYYYKDELYADNPDWDNTQVVQLLTNPGKLAMYNILILNCGSAYQRWVDQYPNMVWTIRDWVKAGGSLYTSDLSWIIGEKAFPDAVDFYGIDDKGGMAKDGPQIIDGNQDFPANIVDAAMAAYVGGSETSVHYGAGPLISVADVAPDTTVHVRAHIKQCQGFFDSCTSGVKLNESQPVLVSYRPGPASGRVVYSCLHVDEQEDQELYDRILYYMMFML